MRPVNPGRGEVGLRIDGQDYILAYTMGGSMAFQSAMGVEGLGPLGVLVIGKDLRALFHGVRCLTVEGDIAKLEGLSYANGGLDAVYDALVAVLMSASSQKDDTSKNANGGAASQNQGLSLPADGSA